MDRPLEATEIRNKRLKRWAPGLLLVAAVGVGFSVLPGWIRPSVRRDQLRTALVEQGPLEATLSSAGVVVPAYEHVVSSPIETRVERILKRPGELVAEGDALVELDVHEFRLALERLDEELALKQNERERERLSLVQELDDLQTRRQIKQLESESLQLTATRDEKLFARGLITEEKARAARVDAERAILELAQVGASLGHAQRGAAADRQRLDLELRILQTRRSEAAHRLELATARSDRRGVVTWVLPHEGVSVHRGDEIARVADLSAFKVEAQLSDVHAGRIAPGMPARVRVGDNLMPGSVLRVLPTVEAGALQLEIALDDAAGSNLRPNLRAEVFLVTDRRDQALSIPRGPYPMEEGLRVVFVVEGDVARRRLVRLGLASFERFEVTEGLVVGDEVVLSDMTDHAHAQEVRIR